MKNELNSILISHLQRFLKLTVRLASISLAAGLMMFSGACSAPQSNKGITAGFPENYPVLHPKFRQWPTPAQNMIPPCNPPSLLWPARQKKGTTYDIRLSPDSIFQSAETISAESIPWTMYNPHRMLKEGYWYWQYRIHSDTWSETNSFQITGESGDFVSPPVEKLIASISTGHPRVLLEKKNLPSFRQEVQNLPDALSIIRDADQFLNESLPEENEGKSRIKGENEFQNEKLAQNFSLQLSNKVFRNIDSWCKAYIITNDEKYAGQAVKLAMKVASWDPSGITFLSDFGDSRCMVSMALVFDTFYDQLSSDQKSTLLKAIKIRTDRFFNAWVNTIDPKLLSAHVWQYMLNYFLNTALAVYGDIENAGEWINYIYELWLARAPVMGGNQGGWLEGASYFRLNMESLLDIPMIIKNHTGFDFIQKHPWYQENAWWMIYSFPPGSSSDGFGDDTERIFEPGQEYLAYADALSKLTGSKPAAWYADQIASRNKINVSDAAMLRWFRLRYLNNQKAPVPAVPAEWSQSIAFFDIGVAAMHNDIANTENDIMIAMRSSPYGSYGHMLADQNTFNILAGGKRLFYHSGFKVAMDDPHRLLWYKHTRGHNGILIDNLGQPFDVESYGWIARFLDGKSLSYAVGDASHAYKSKAEKQDAGLKKFRRHILFLRPETIVVYDELEAHHDAAWSWLIHSPQKIVIDSLNNEFTCNLENVYSKSGLFASQAVQWSLTDTFAIPVTNWTQRTDDEGNLVHYENNQWHLAATSVKKSSAIRFLAILRISRNGKNTEFPLVEKTAGSNELKVGDWMVRAELDVQKPALLEAWRNDNQVSFTSSGDRLFLNNKYYSGKVEGSSKLVELINGKPVLSETGDQVPEVVKEIPANLSGLSGNKTGKQL